MSKTELEDVQALLERVVSEPGVFAGRLLQQAIAQYGLVSEPAATAFYTAMAEDVTASETVIVPDEWSADETSLDTNALLAAALGACECWGLRADCHQCQGQGSSGWIQPDPELFEEFAGPAIAKLPGISDGGHEQHGNVKADEASDNHHTAQGENA